MSCPVSANEAVRALKNTGQLSTWGAIKNHLLTEWMGHEFSLPETHQEDNHELFSTLSPTALVMLQWTAMDYSFPFAVPKYGHQRAQAT